MPIYRCRYIFPCCLVSDAMCFVCKLTLKGKERSSHHRARRERKSLLL